MQNETEVGGNALLIDVFSDVVCPWCFIGKRYLEQTLQILARDKPDLKVTVRWQPYFLDPGAPMEGDAYRPHLEQKFGGAAKVDALFAQVEAAAREAGLTLALDKIRLRPNTLNAHRLIHRFQQRGNADALVERLFAAHFQHGEFIGDKQLLIRLAVECGDDAAAVAAYLDTLEGSVAVLEQAVRARKAGITGVPFFIFNGKQAMTGAQPPEQMLGIIEQVLKG